MQRIVLIGLDDTAQALTGIPSCHSLSSETLNSYCQDAIDWGTNGVQSAETFPGRLRRSLWPKYKELRSKYPGENIGIVYPAKLIHNGAVISGMFPNWSKIMRGRRLNGHSRSEQTMSADDTALVPRATRESGVHPPKPGQHIRTTAHNDSVNTSSCVYIYIYIYI